MLSSRLRCIHLPTHRDLIAARWVVHTWWEETSGFHSAILALCVFHTHYVVARILPMHGCEFTYESVAQQNVCMRCESIQLTFRAARLFLTFLPDGRRTGHDGYSPIPGDMALPWQQKQDCSIFSQAQPPAVPEEFILSRHLNCWVSPSGETEPAFITYSSPDHRMHICRSNISLVLSGVLWIDP